MNKLQLLTDYKHEQNLRESFNALALQTFHIEFESLYTSGLWNNRYRCYSLADNGKIISNVSVSHLTVQIEEETYRAVQIGTVMTDPAYQRKGLAGQLMEQVIASCEDVDLIYLFANKEAASFYEKWGFTTQQEHQFMLPLKPRYSQIDRVQKLQPAARTPDLMRLIDLHNKRRSLSPVLDVRDSQHILGFYAIGPLRDAFYYVPEQHMVLIYEADGNVLHLYDVITDKAISWDNLQPYLALPGVTEVYCHFTPGFPDAEAKLQIAPKHGDVLYVNKPLAIKAPFQFPLLTHA